MKRALAYSQMGLELALTVGLGVAAGMWAERRLGGRPWGMLAGLFLGAALGMTRFIRAAMRMPEGGEKG